MSDSPKTRGPRIAPKKKITFQEIIADKQLTQDELVKDIANLKKWKPTGEKQSFAGNKMLYHFQMENLLRTRVVGKKKILEEILVNDEEYAKLERNVEKLGRTGTMPNRFFEAFRFNQSVVFFKPSTAKWVYQKFQATHVLDPTAGWGGRMLGANALGIHYTGIDTNMSLQPAYQGMMNLIQDPKMRMIWEDTLAVDYEAIDYDFVLTSTPYVNKAGKMVEVYEHQVVMDDFYGKFLVPLIQKCLRYIKRNGRVCFNMSSTMYDEVERRFRPADEQFDMLQQKRLSKDKREQMYVWIV
jgi:tRNA G10  N-methylase Trm11